MSEKRQGRLTTLRSRVARLDTRSAKPPPKETESFYHSAEWRALIASVIEDRGRRCEDTNCQTPSGPWRRIFGDHIKELKDGGAPLDPDNVLLRCGSCHTRKTVAERAKRMRA